MLKNGSMMRFYYDMDADSNVHVTLIHDDVNGSINVHAIMISHG